MGPVLSAAWHGVLGRLLRSRQAQKAAEGSECEAHTGICAEFPESEGNGTSTAKQCPSQRHKCTFYHLREAEESL